MAFCFPLFLLLTRVAGREASPGHWAVEAMGFVVAWLAFAVASHQMATLALRRADWPRFISAWNWTNVLQYLCLCAASLMGSALGTTAMQLLSLLSVAYALWLEWFTTRAALGVAGPAAVLFVLLDLAIGLFVQGFIARSGG
ncbi:MAG: hypothetical protein RMK64_00370 [Rhodovarius sp.]|nr:hypothetical protein [Rhodovarius sp.]MCX7933483.1 hypothetical protein [Rhodovarius sp.]MDW8313396.1 hypothetical protein [Rhodovarius sp.]